MQIVLICQYESGGIGLNAARIDGVHVPERHYEIVNHQVLLEGDDSVIHHDVDELLAMGDLYRLPKPKEQDAIAKSQQDASSSQETTKTPDQPKKTSG
jgi:hypothetical protein